MSDTSNVFIENVLQTLVSESPQRRKVELRVGSSAVFCCCSLFLNSSHGGSESHASLWHYQWTKTCYGYPAVLRLISDYSSYGKLAYTVPRLTKPSPLLVLAPFGIFCFLYFFSSLLLFARTSPMSPSANNSRKSCYMRNR